MNWCRKVWLKLKCSRCSVCTKHCTSLYICAHAWVGIRKCTWIKKSLSIPTYLLMVNKYTTLSLNLPMMSVLLVRFLVIWIDAPKGTEIGSAVLMIMTLYLFHLNSGLRTFHVNSAVSVLSTCSSHAMLVHISCTVTPLTLYSVSYPDFLCVVSKISTWRRPNVDTSYIFHDPFHDHQNSTTNLNRVIPAQLKQGCTSYVMDFFLNKNICSFQVVTPQSMVQMQFVPFWDPTTFHWNILWVWKCHIWNLEQETA